MQKRVWYNSYYKLNYIIIIMIFSLIFSVQFGCKRKPPVQKKEAESTSKAAANIPKNNNLNENGNQEQLDENALFNKAAQYHSTNDEVFIPENNYINAIKTYKKVVQLNPKSPLAPRAQYMAAKLTEEYIKYINRKKRIEIENLAVRPEEKSFDNILKNMQPFDEAVNEYIKMAEMYPNNSNAPESLFRAAQLLTEDYNINKDYNKAINLYDILIKKFPNSGYEDYAQYRIGDCYRYLNNYDKAIEAYTKLIQKYPESQYIVEAENKIERLKLQLKLR